MPKTSKNQLRNNDYEDLGRAVDAILQSEFVQRREALKNRLLMGIAGGVGGVIGATIAIALLLWVLSLFRNIDPLKPFVEKTTETIQQR